MATLNVFQWLRYGPWLAQVVVTRRCNLTCGYCTEYDRTSDPAPYEELALRLAKLAELRAWAVCLTGGEPTMHPRLPDLVAEMRRLGFKRRMPITNGWRLTPALFDALNRTVRACQERDAVAGWTLTGSNQADVGSISLRSGTMVTPQMVLRGAIARTGVRPFPLSLTYEVTWLCNLSCGYCDRHTPMRHELTQEEIFWALDEFRMLGMLHTHLDGGDPLTHRHIDEIVDWLTQRGVTVSLNSNGILVPKKLHTIRKLSLLKISLDGPPDSHDAMRGTGSFEKALAGATAARDAGVKVEFTCTVGQHNAHTIEPLIDIASAVSIPVVFQPALNSLFLGADRDGSSWQLDVQSIRAAFARIERIKRRSNVVGNGWSSLRHFRRFPEDTRPPCAAGWVMATMDPEGVLFSCPQLNRSDRSNSVTRLGAATAFANLSRTGCGQCWCARLVEGNYAWGMRVDRMLPPFERLPRQSRGAA